MEFSILPIRCTRFSLSKGREEFSKPAKSGNAGGSTQEGERERVELRSFEMHNSHEVETSDDETSDESYSERVLDFERSWGGGTTVLLASLVSPRTPGYMLVFELLFLLRYIECMRLTVSLVLAVYL